MAEDREWRDPDGYTRARVDFLAEQIAMLRQSVQDNMRDVKAETSRMEERLKMTITESEKRGADRVEHISKAMVEQNATIRDALREDRQQWITAIEHTQNQFLATTKVLEEKYQTFVPVQRTVLMLMGALALLGYLAKPFLDKLLK